MYGPSRARVKHTQFAGAAVSKTITYIGADFERRAPASGPAALVHYVRANGTVVAEVTTVDDGNPATDKTRYLHRDHLGSVALVTDEAGNVAEERSFGPWGEARNTDWSTPAAPPPLLETPRGFTGHEHIQTVGLIHMNGRVYDPKIGRFMSPDPSDALDPGVGFNRYAYVKNNPVSLTDPSGFCVWDACAVETLAVLGAAAIVHAAWNSEEGKKLQKQLKESWVRAQRRADEAMEDSDINMGEPDRGHRPGGPAPVGGPNPDDDDDDKKSFAMGRQEHLDEFAGKRNAETWKDYPQDPWYDTVERKLFDPLQEKLFNLEDVKNPLAEALAGVAAINAGMHPDNIPGVQFELGTIMENGLEEDIDWWDGDERKDEDYNPFEDQ